MENLGHFWVIRTASWSDCANMKPSKDAVRSLPSLTQCCWPPEWMKPRDLRKGKQTRLCASGSARVRLGIHKQSELQYNVRLAEVAARQQPWLGTRECPLTPFLR